MRIDRIEVAALSVPLREPFVIATGRMEATRAVLVDVSATGERGDTARGYGEAAALPPVTHEDQPDLLRSLREAADALEGTRLTSLPQLGRQLDALLSGRPAARAGLEAALLDAMARLNGRSVHALLAPSSSPPPSLSTDITLSIQAPDAMVRTALDYRARGFGVFKVKVGRDRAADAAALAAVHRAVPDARFRLDANGGFTAPEALQLLEDIRQVQLPLECFEQPCAAADLDAMAKVTAAAQVPVIADESVKTLADLERVAQRGAAHGVNLKLAKSGGLRTAHAIGCRAQQLGMPVMVGGMVETRLGMTAMAHVACALGGVDFVDLDTAWLLADDPFEGGYEAQGPRYRLPPVPGFGISPRSG